MKENGFSFPKKHPVEGWHWHYLFWDVPSPPCMDLKPAVVSSPSLQGDLSSRSTHQEDGPVCEPEDPFSLSGPSISLLGVAIAIAAVVVPLVAVLTDRPEGDSTVPTALEHDGSKSSFPVSLTAANRITGLSFEAASLLNPSEEHAHVNPFFYQPPWLVRVGESLSPSPFIYTIANMSAVVKQIRRLFSVSCRFFSA